MARLRRGWLNNDVRASCSSSRHRFGSTSQSSCPQRRPALRAPDQSVGGAPERLPARAVQQEVRREVDVEEMLNDLLYEDEQTTGQVGRVDSRTDEDVNAHGVAGNVEQQKHRRHQQQHLCHLQHRDYRVRQKSVPLKFFAIFSATLWDLM